jgi:phenylacetate-coenzyme A ligase PaaK-like adenylate-forming protein
MSSDRPFVDPSPAGWQAFFASVPLYRDDDDPAFWPAERLAARRDELLVRQMGWLAEGSAHYRAKFEAAGVDPAKVRTTDDLQMLPVTTKAELMADPASFRLRLADSNLYDMTYATVYTTGTTTGRPTPYEYTTHDFLGVLLAGRRTYKHTGLRPGDRFLTMFPLSPLPHVAGFAGAIANAAGLSFSHGFTGMPYPEFPVHRPGTALLDQLLALRPECVAGIGSFLRRMFVEWAAEGVDLSFLKVVIASGEVLTKRMRDHMRANLEACGARDVFISSTYGFTEGGVAWVPSGEDGALYATAPDQVFLEILDPETHQRLPDGEAGLVALTHLNRRGMPLVRYILGDISALTHEVDGRSGRGGEGLVISSGSAHVSRTSELLKIKGTLVNPQIIHDVVMNTSGVVEYQMIVTNVDEGDALSPERLLLRVGLGADVDGEAWTGTDGAELRRRIQGAVEVTPELQLVGQSEIYDPNRDFKAQRIIDRRPKE